MWYFIGFKVLETTYREILKDQYVNRENGNVMKLDQVRKVA